MSTFHLQIVTPDGGFFDGEAEKLIVRAIDGDVCILARHSPYVTALGTGEARVTIDGKRRRAACAGGMLAVTKVHYFVSSDICPRALLFSNLFISILWWTNVRF